MAIIEKIKQGLNDTKMIDKAIEVLKENFKEDDFAFQHSLRVGLILKKMGSKDTVIISGILHEISEESRKKIKKEFEKDIPFLIKKVKRLSSLRYHKKRIKIVPIHKRQKQKILLDSQSENLRKMFFVITKDIRAIFIKLADRLDIMRNLKQFSEEHQKRIALESIEIFAPLAYGIGMGETKGEFEDLAFPCLYPKEFNWIIEKVRERHTKKEKYLKRVKSALIKILDNENVPFIDIHKRAKYYFSLYEKLLRHNMDFSKIYDLVAIRIIVSNVEDCYKTLGIIHKAWNPLPGRIKDYIALPKKNGYKALHTTVFCLDNKITEFQIKTLEMHNESEHGIAAHLAYKENISQKIYKDRFSWANELRSLTEKIKNAENLSEYLDFNLFRHKVFVFTPKGEVISLPKGSCAIDFAFAIHTEIGTHCKEVKINKKMSKLSRPLKNGDLIEIITSKNETVSADWLKFVKTKSAEEKIKKIKNISLKHESPIKRKLFLLKKLIPFKKKLKKAETQKVYLGKETGFSISIAKCCSPKSGDKIKGFISKEKGVSIHKIGCKDLKKLQKKWPQKVIDASWGSPKD
jgi:GTP pyrophosphokinase